MKLLKKKKLKIKINFNLKNINHIHRSLNIYLSNLYVLENINFINYSLKIKIKLYYLYILTYKVFYGSSI